MKTLTKGIDLPVMGGVKDKTITPHESLRVAVRGGVDIHGLKPAMKVKVGDTVTVGQPIFVHKANPQVHYPAPVSGTVVDINRGERRSLQSVVIESDGKDTPIQKFAPLTPKSTRQDVLDTLVASGLFAFFKTRPYDNTPNPADMPDAIFINTMDTHPLSVREGLVINHGDTAQYLKSGAEIIAMLTQGKTFVTAHPDTKLPSFDTSITVEHFSGPHPAGAVGTHIHFLRPVSATKTVWTIGYQDVINIGRLVSRGVLKFERVIAVAGPESDASGYYRVRVGCAIMPLANPNGRDDVRVINGSILTGDAVNDATAYLGLTTTQVSVMANYTESRAVGWVIPWFDKFSSVLNVHFSAFNRNKEQRFDTALNGSYRALIPVGHLEQLTPLDILPSQLMRYVLIGDTDTAQKLGLLELSEEDIALFAYADIGKNDFLGAFRECLTKVEKEG